MVPSQDLGQDVAKSVDPNLSHSQTEKSISATTSLMIRFA
jgi:hypothetical protein